MKEILALVLSGAFFVMAYTFISIGMALCNLALGVHK